MFQFFFKYPIPVFSKGKFVLLGAWPSWVLLLLMVACAAGLAVLIWSRLPQAAAKISKWRAGAVWLLQSLLIATVLVLLCGGDKGSQSKDISTAKRLAAEWSD